MAGISTQGKRLKLIGPSVTRGIWAGSASGCSALLLLAWATPAVVAQDSNSSAQPAGPQITSVSVYAAYYSKGLPETGGAQANLPNLSSDVGVGGSVSLAWSKFTERTSFSLSYTPSYTAQLRYTSLDALNHSFSLNLTRKLAPRWSLGFSVGANYSTQEESLFAPTALSNVLSVPSNFTQLASGLLSGNSGGNPQLGVVLTSSPLVQSPLENLLYGQRVLTASAQSNLSYRFSPRLSMTFTGGGNRTQYLSQNQPATTSATSLLANTTSGTAGAGLSYSLTPAAQLGATVTAARVSSSFEDAYTTTSLATFGTTLAQRWIVQLHGGVAVVNPVRQTFVAVGTKPLPSAGGSLAFKVTGQTFMGTLDRTASDSYGLGASTSTSAGFAWQWHRPGSLWSAQTSFGWQKLEGGVTENTSAWRLTAGASRALSPHLSILCQYTYLNYSGGLQGVAYGLSESAVRVSMVWTPLAASLR